MSQTRFVLDGRPVEAESAVLGATTGLVRSGEGWFETLRGEAGRWMFEADHLARMVGSIAAAGGDADAAFRSLRATLDAAPAARERSSRLRLLVTPSEEVAGGWQSLAEVGSYEPPESLYEQGVALASAGFDHPGLGGFGKSASYHWSALAQASAERVGAQEALFWRGGLAAEGARSTLLWREGGEWWTPSMAGLLASVTLAQLEAEGVAVERGALDAARLQACEGLLLVSALRLVAPVRSLDGRALPVLRDEAAALRSSLLALHAGAR